MNPNAPLCDIPSDLRPRVEAALARRSEPQADGCIVWTGSKNAKGYGRLTFMIGGGDTRQFHIRVHRAAWILARGPIEDPSLVLDHLCRNRSCMNPDHLELVTVTENRRRGIPERGRKAAGATSCKWGHPWPEHLYVYTSATGTLGYNCRACSRERWRKGKRADA